MTNAHNLHRSVRRVTVGIAASMLLTGWLPTDRLQRLASATNAVTGTRAYSFWSDVGRVELSDTQPVELGLKFRTDVDGKIKAIRFYRHVPIDSGYTVHVWNGKGDLLGTGVSFEGQQPTPGWQTVEVYPPVSIIAKKTYVASYYASKGQYTVTENFFHRSVIRSGPLVGLMNRRINGGNGVYVYGQGGGFPTETYKASNYWVDVVFTPTPPQ
jgi:hypothetical protein